MDLPTIKDLFALPTNVGLTIWDAAPIMVTVGAATAILILQLPPALARTAWSLRRLIAIESIVMVLLSAPIVVLAFPIAWVLAYLSRRSTELPSDNARLPASPLSAAVDRALEIFTSIAAGALIAGTLDLLVRPYVSAPDFLLVLLAGAILIALRIGPPGTIVFAISVFTYGNGPIGALIVSTLSMVMEAKRTTRPKIFADPQASVRRALRSRPASDD